MSRPPTPTAMLDLPVAAGRDVLRAGLMAMRVLPGVMPADRNGRDEVLRGLVAHPATVIFIDISRKNGAPGSTLLQLDAVMPRDETRRRVILTRLGSGHVSGADRRWVRSLGFGDLLADFDARDCEGGLRSALDSVARLLDLPPLAPAALERYARALTEGRGNKNPRRTVRNLAGSSAEAFAELLLRSLDLRDRSYRLQNYPGCFVGSEAVAWIARHLRCSPQHAVAVGQALGELGLLSHVVQEHPFLDEHLFYRLTLSDAADRLELDEASATLRGKGGLAIADRVYLGKTYRRCWVGSQAVDKLCSRFGLARHDAWVIMHRLMQFGLFEHVTHARPFIDGPFFYRFGGLPAEPVV
jgi:hypothetical protein